MKVVRGILSVIACFIIAIGIFSVIGYELYFRHVEPTLPSQLQKPDTTTTTDVPETKPEEPEPQPEPDPVPEEPSAEELRAQELLQDMTLEQKIYQMFFITPESITNVEAATQAGSKTKEALQANPVGGILYSDKNLENADQVKKLLEGTQNYLKEGQFFPAFLAIDEEGGDVAPVAQALKTTAFETMAELGTAGKTDAVKDMGKTIAQDIKELGFNVNLAPLADLADATHNDVIGTRSFGLNPEVVSSMVSAMVLGSQDNGVLCAVSHFPGLGSLEDVAHIDRSTIDRTLEQMEQEELLPFQSAISAKAGFIVVSHAVFSAVDDQRPASLSPSVIEMLRSEMGYHGVIVTDTLDIPAITDHYTPEEAALNAVKAGCDMLLCPSDLDKSIEALLNAVEDNTISEERINESVTRILAAKLTLGLIS